MIERREISVSFTGHRSYDGQYPERLLQAVARLYARGYRRFLTGMAMGFDIAAAEAVMACRLTMPDVQLVAVVPFRGQAERFPARERQRYESIMAAADEVVVLSETYDVGAYRRRNNYLIDHASVLVAWDEGQAGGTHYTVMRGQRACLEVINLAQGAYQPPHSLFDI